MTGYINNILTAESGYEYGYITGDDGNSYYFDERHLSGKFKMTDCDFRDEVEFEAGAAKDGRRYKCAQKVILVKFEKMKDGNKCEKKEIKH